MLFSLMYLPNYVWRCTRIAGAYSQVAITDLFAIYHYKYMWRMCTCAGRQKKDVKIFPHPTSRRLCPFVQCQTQVQREVQG
jgi:hypothetical protein